MGSQIKELIFEPHDEGVVFMVICNEGNEKFLNTLFMDVTRRIDKHNDDVRNQTAFSYDDFITDTEFLMRTTRNKYGETVLSGNISKAFVMTPSYRIIANHFIKPLLDEAGLTNF